MEKIAFRFYSTLSNDILVVHSFINGQFLFYDGISARLLHNWLLEDTEKVSSVLIENNISVSEWNDFTADFLYQLEEKIEPQETVSTEYNYSEADIYEELYQAGFMYSFHLDLTQKCNFRCKHCYHPFDSYTKDDISFSEIEELFKKLDKLGVFKLVLSGGEPLMRSDIWNILELTKEYSFIVEIYSNGFLVDEDVVKRLKQYPVALLSFSYYGNEESTQKITNSTKAYNHLMRAIELCKENQIIFELKYIILKENIDCITQSREFCKENSLPLSFELCITPKIDGTNDNLSSKITEEEYVKVILENRDIMLYPPKNNNVNSDVECNAGRYSLYCDFSGELFPCVSWRKSLGRISDIENIWKNTWEEKHLHREKCDNFPSFDKYSFCKYCYQICPGLTCLEKGIDNDCYNSGCEISKIVEKIYNGEI